MTDRKLGADTVPLPHGWSIRRNTCVGVDMVDDKGAIVSQNPYDMTAWRQEVLSSKSRCKKCGYESIFLQWNGYIAGGDSHCLNCGAYRSFENMTKKVR